MKKFVILAAIFIFAFAGTAFARGESYWIGDLKDTHGENLASNLSVRVDSRRMDIPVYSIMLKYKPGAFLPPITINNEDIKSGKPAKIIWKGCYNGFFEEKETIFEGGHGTELITFTSSESSNRPDMFAIDGTVVWTSSTGRHNDKICIVWDNEMNSRIYLGADFKEMIDIFNISTQIEGYKVIK